LILAQRQWTNNLLMPKNMVSRAGFEPATR
jgi:hypothetical protein